MRHPLLDKAEPDIQDACYAFFSNSVHLLSWTCKSHSIQKSAKTFAAKLNKSNCVGVVVGPHKTLVLVPDLCLVHKCFQPFQVQVPGSEGLESCPTVTAVIQLRTLL